MGATARWVFDVSWQAGILIVFVMALRRILGSKLTPAWRCALWALVAIRLLIPGLIPLPTPGGGVASATPSPAATPDTSGFTVTVTKLWDGLTSHHPSTGATPTPGQSAGSDSDHLRADRRSADPDSSRPATLLSWTWAAITLLLLARLAATNLRLARRIRRMTPITDDRILTAITECAAEMGVRPDITAVSTADVRTPAIYGLRRPVLMLPATYPLADDDLRMVLLHELAHVRRRDVHVELLAGLLTALHWFNPLVWLAASLCRADRELACDDAVLRRVGPARRHDYGACLLRVVEAVGAIRPAPAAVGVFGSKGNLRRRIHMIASCHGTGTPAARWAAGLAAFVAIGCAAATGPGAAKLTPEFPQAKQTAAPQVAIPPTGADPASQAILDKRLPDVHFDNTPLGQVMDHLRETTGANLFVNWRAMEAAGIDRNAPVTVRMRDVRFARALDSVLRAAGGGTAKLGYEAQEGVITITTADDLTRNVVTRVYDIRDLLVEIPDSLSPALTPPPAATRPASTQAETPPPPPTREQRVEQILDVLRETVAPDSWRDRGGTVGSVRELSGQLIVSQTPENHAAVAQLLDTLREGRGVQLTFQARYVYVDQDALEDLGMGWLNDPAKKGTSGTFLTDDKVDAFLRAARKSHASTILTAPRLTLFNGQRAVVKVATAAAYVKDFVIVHTKDGDTRYEPQMAAAEAGLTLDLRGTVSADRKSVTTSVRSVLSALNGINSRPFPGAPAGDLQVQSPDLTQRTTQTTASIPDGQSLLLIAMTPEAAATATTRPKGQTFILIKPTILLQRETPPHTPSPK